MKPTLATIPDFDTFEKLAYWYFKDFKAINSKDDKYKFHVKNVTPPGTGTDGGKDFFVWFEIEDHVTSYVKKWLVQCKWKKNGKGSISPSHLKDDEISTLTQSYEAQGYLLITNAKVSQKLVDQFQRLSENCHLKCSYKHWDGTDFMGYLWDLESMKIWKLFFYKYYQQIQNKKK